MPRFFPRPAWSFTFAAALITNGGCQALFGPCGSNYPADQAHRVSIDEGVWGQVWLFQGNFMPTDDSCPKDRGRVLPVARTIYFFELTSRQQLTPAPQLGAQFFSAISSRLVDSTTSDSHGFYEIHLAPGVYSVLIRENGAYHVLGWNDENVLPITVEAGKVLTLQLNMWYLASV